MGKWASLRVTPPPRRAIFFPPSSGSQVNALSLRAIQRGLLDLDSVEDARRFLHWHVLDHQHCAGAQLGLSDGSFHSVRRTPTPNGVAFEASTNRPGTGNRRHRLRLDERGDAVEYLGAAPGLPGNATAWYREAERVRVGGWVGPGAAGAAPAPAVRAYRPFYAADGGLRGVLATDWDLRGVAAALRTADACPACRAALIDAEGRLAADSRNDTLSADAGPDADPLPALAGPYLRGGRAARAPVYHNGRRFALRTAPLGYGLTWTLAVLAPADAFTGPIVAGRTRALCLCGGLAGVSALVALGLAACLLAPLRALAAQADAIAAGALDGDARPGGCGAVYALTRAAWAGLAEREQRLRLVLRHLPVGVVVFGAEGSVQLLNPEGHQLLTADEPPEDCETVGPLPAMGQLFQGPDAPRAGDVLPFHRALVGHTVRHCRLELQAPAGPVPVEAAVAPLYRSGRVAQGVMVFHAVGARARLPGGPSRGSWRSSRRPRPRPSWRARPRAGSWRT